MRQTDTLEYVVSHTYNDKIYHDGMLCHDLGIDGDVRCEWRR